MEGEKPYLVHLKFAEHSDNERKMRVKKKMLTAVRAYDLAPDGPNITFITEAIYLPEQLWCRIKGRIGKEDFHNEDALYVSPLGDSRARDCIESLIPQNPPLNKTF
ncbi:hypothetical protein [Desulfovibrio sp.]|uniref:hypothetical protein n=1 Tax=Desulfovibrio sp. TaxID=885 RepID=UPI0025BA7F09|nr:hypothetical protein [Desulfovibrio sp.]